MSLKSDNQSKENKEKELFSRYLLSKKGFIEINGKVIEALPATTFRVKLENGHEVLAHLSGKIRMNKILLIPGDRVKVEISPYDLTKGRVVYRY